MGLKTGYLLFGRSVVRCIWCSHSKYTACMCEMHSVQLFIDNGWEKDDTEKFDSYARMSKSLTQLSGLIIGSNGKLVFDIGQA